ncbi:MAG: 30S ribosomal protein S7 [Ignavibacteriae bacterium]|nr:30S ribosomal protein S7 [Ignavibacteria bacterium]MBI3364490.1 30S ribosomal protein S7 [Ignavibacteriota bacterium]
MRKKTASKRIIIPDPKYNDVLVAKFINSVLKQGKKHLARRIIYDAFDIIEQRTKSPGIDVFKKAVHNVKPVLEIRARRVGGATYQIPTEVRQDRSIALAIRWIITYASDRKDKSMSLKLASEFLAAANNEGNAVKKKEDTHKMAEANKAFAHFKW